jgi:hypothetical protein
MRYAFIITIIVLLQLFSFGAACSLEWWLQPWSSPLLIQVTWLAVFAITNILLLLSVTNRAIEQYIVWWFLAFTCFGYSYFL